MSEEGIEHPLLSTLACSTATTRKSMAKRYRRCFSTPQIDPPDYKPTLSEENFHIKMLFRNVRPSFKCVGVLLFAYLGTATATFYLTRNQINGKQTEPIVDALYFTVVTMTTVGYGDLFPNSVMTKLLCCIFVFTGMALVALFLSKSADYLVEKQEIMFFQALRMQMNDGESHLLRAIESNKVKYKFWSTACMVVTLIFTGTLFLWKVENMTLVDSFYCVCATITTLGYGDKSFQSAWGRLFAVFWIVISTICVAQFFLYLAEYATEHRQRKLANWVLKRKMNNTDLEAADLDSDGHVGVAEFVLYKLKELGKITQEDVLPFLEEFEELDVDHSGTLSRNDLALAGSNP